MTRPGRVPGRGAVVGLPAAILARGFEADAPRGQSPATMKVALGAPATMKVALGAPAGEGRTAAHTERVRSGCTSPRAHPIRAFARFFEFRQGFGPVPFGGPAVGRGGVRCRLRGPGVPVDRTPARPRRLIAIVAAHDVEVAPS